MPINTRTLAEESVVVSDTPLRLCGASSWTGADARNTDDRIIEVTNNGTTHSVFLKTIVAAAALPNKATLEADYHVKIDPGKRAEVFVRAGQDVAIVRGAASANKVTARVHIL